jgi:O-antigen/teichoic acid export membrane protein
MSKTTTLNRHPRGTLDGLIRLFSSKIAVIVSSFLLSIVLARGLGPEGRGAYGMYMAVIGLVVCMGRLGISQSIAFYTGKESDVSNKLFASVICIWAGSALLASCIGYFLMKQQGLAAEYFKATIFAVSVIPFCLFLNYMKGMVLGKNKVGKYSGLVAMEPAVVLILAIFTIVVLRLDVLGAVLAFLLGTIFVSFLSIWGLRHYIIFKFLPDMVLIRKMLSFGITYGAILFLASINYRVDVLILKIFVPLTEIGKYSVAASFAELMWLLPQSLGIVIFARNVSRSKIETDSLDIPLIRAFKFNFIIMCLLGVSLFVLAPLFFTTFYGKAYAESGHIIRVLLPGVICATFYKVLYSDMAGKGIVKPFLKTFLVGAVINIVLNFLLIPVMGVGGAAVASSVSYSYVGFLMLYLYKVRFNIRMTNMFILNAQDIAVLKEGIRKKFGIK